MGYLARFGEAEIVSTGESYRVFAVDVTRNAREDLPRGKNMNGSPSKSQIDTCAATAAVWKNMFGGAC